jgi:hypothetical protein
MTDYIKGWKQGSGIWFQEADRIAQELSTECTFKDGVARWNSNGRCIPEDIAQFAAYLDHKIDLEKHEAAMRHDNRIFIQGYREVQAKRSPEEIAEQRAEARAAMGPGVEMVNMFTGEKWRT